MTYRIAVPVERLTHETFAPFGQIVGELPGEPAWQRPQLTSWRMDFSCDGKADLKVNRYEYQPMSFSKLELHINHTETRIPLKSGRFVMIVAPAPADTEQASLPSPESIRAFLVDGTVGILIWPSVWHSIDTYPVQPPYVDCAFICEKSVQAEIEVVGGDLSTARLTRIADFSMIDTEFYVVDPDNVVV